MDEFAGAYGDKRRAAAAGRLYGSMVEQGSVVVRKLGRTRGGELSAHRVLGSARVTPEQTLDCLARRTAAACAGRRVVAAQDTTEVSFAGRRPRGLGPAGQRGRGRDAPGFFIHATVAVDADADAVLGVVDAVIWTRSSQAPPARRGRGLAGKESRRWLDAAHAAAHRLGGASSLVVVGDRESDLYALFSRTPPGVDLVVRAAQNRALQDGSLLFDASASWPVGGAHAVAVCARGAPGQARTAVVGVRAGPVVLRHPRNALPEGDAGSVALALVEAIEADPPPGEAALHWRLLTTLPAHTLAEAAEVVRLYRLRWRIEQTFRMLKRDGLRLEDAQTATPHSLFNLAALAVGAAARIIQLVDARNGSTQPAADVASQAQVAAAVALRPTLEGRTTRQRNPHPEQSLAWLSWIVARLGGWNCYGKPPGPKTMHDGWTRFAAIAQGYALMHKATHDV